jgi:arylsulfatase A-like enzyme/cytochrome c-type biogenesis protein CcmH/NrfG
LPAAFRYALVLAVLCPLPFGVTIACVPGTSEPPRARHVVLITIDTLRADHLGAYGYTRARTPNLDALARGGALFDRAYAAAPITLPSHATLLTGRYPPGHGARDNGVRISASVPTLADALKARGFSTAAFVAAFPLDHQFGLNRGFDVYGDRLPRGADGRPASERPASQVVDDAIAWLRSRDAESRIPHPESHIFLWLHLFDPHAPYGDPSSGRSAIDRYDDEIATVDREIGRLLDAVGPARAQTLVVVAGDHGEAFGEHGEYAHSIFVYDTTLRVPLVMSGPGVRAGARIGDPVTLADVAPTVMRLAGGAFADADGIDLSPAIGGAAIARRELYAESFAPLVEFGWAPLRSVRSGPWKFVAAPKPELFDVAKDPDEQVNLAAAQPTVVRDLETRVSRYSGASLPTTASANAEAAERLRALGYSAGSAIRDQQSATSRPDPKDRRDVAARIAQVTSGELSGAALVSALEGIVRDDPSNGQAHLRLGYARLQAGDCARAEPEFHAAAAAGLPSADIYLGLATCLGQKRDLAGADRALNEARRLEPDNPSVTANIGLLQAAKGHLPAAIQSLRAALAADPNLHEARFNLAIAYAKSGRRAEAAAAARELLNRLPPDAPQRTEVERLLRAVQ